jgi:hypothetical protein
MSDSIRTEDLHDISLHPTVETKPARADGKIILDEIDGFEYTGYAFSTRKKWWILTVVALCQTSMNFVRNSWPFSHDSFR